jgi:hypothetical protein
VKRLLKIVLAMAAVSSAAWGAGLYLARRMEEGRGFSESDDFRVAAVWGGREFESTAPALRSGWVRTVLGGVALDLRGAALHPDGADLRLEAVLGGIAVVVPSGWRVTVDQEVSGGAVDLDLPDPDSVPEDAPELRILASAHNGGIAVGVRDEQ